jgi:hypothetical protein
MIGMDPWYDYLALPVAPLLLLVQLGALFIRPALWRWGISIACAVAIAAMFLYVDSRPVHPDEGVNIGAGVLVLWLVASLAVLAMGVVRDVVAGVVRAVRRSY